MIKALALNNRRYHIRFKFFKSWGSKGGIKVVQ